MQYTPREIMTAAALTTKRLIMLSILQDFKKKAQSKWKAVEGERDEDISVQIEVFRKGHPSSPPSILLIS